MRLRAAPVGWLLALARRRAGARLFLLLGPGLGWVLLFGLVPLGFIAAYSVLTKGQAGAVLPVLTIDNYVRIWQTPLYTGIFGDSLLIGLETTVVSLLLGYPVGYYLGRQRDRGTWLVALVLVPFWTSYLVRIFSWLVILMDNGVINWVLLRLHLVSEPKQLLYTHLGVVIGIVYSALPFVILPVFAVVRNIDEDLINAAKVLGAHDFAAFREVTLPLSLPGIVAAGVLAFIYGAGAFLAPAILGGNDVALISNVIANVFLIFFNWPFAAALTITFLVMIGMVLAVANRLLPLEKIHGHAAG